MKAVIMAGGEGTRLRPLTCERPKPMVPVLNVPVMEHIINLLRQHGIIDIAVTLQYLPEKITEYFKDGKKFGVNLLYSIEESPLGTAGSVKNIEDFLDDTFLVISGDALTDFDLTQIIDFHKRKNAVATLTMTTATNPLDFGIVLTDSSGKITRFLEKPSWSEVFSDTINTGIYVLEPEILKLMKPYQKYDFSRDIFPYLLKENYPLYGVVADDYWCDIGNLEQYKRANFDALQGRVKIHSFEGLQEEQVVLGSESYISKEAEVTGPVLLGRNCKIHRGAKIKGPTIIGDNSVIEMGALVEECLIWDGVYIGERTKLSFSQIGSQCLIKERTLLKENTFVGDHCIIGEGSQINSAAKIWPNKVIPKGVTVCGNVVNTNTVAASLFGSYGISGVANYEITPELVVKIGAAFGSLLKINSTVILSKDNHPCSSVLKKALEIGLQSTGINILGLGITSVSLNSFAITNTGAQGGIHVYTSYQNPNNITMVLLDEQGIEISKSLEKDIESLFSREEFRRISSNQVARALPSANIWNVYVDKLLNFVDSASIANRGFRIAVNFDGCFPKGLLKTIFSELNCELISLTVTESNSKVINIIRNNDCDLGVLVDEVQQNFRLITNEGEILSNDLIQALYSYLSLKGTRHSSSNGETAQNRNIITTIRTSHNIDKICSDLGGEIQRTKTDSRVLKRTCLSEGAVLGGDVKSGIIFPDFSVSQDALVAVVKLLEFLALEDLSLGALISRLPQIEMFKATVDCTVNAKGAFMRRLLEEVKDRDVELFDGVKFFNNKDWFLVLPDPYHPLLHVYGECESVTGQNFLHDSLTMVKRIAKETSAG